MAKRTKKKDSELAIRTADGEVFPLRYDAKAKSLAISWAYRVRHRARWSKSLEARTEVLDAARVALATLGLEPSGLERVARSGLVEVSVPYRSEEEGWELRVLPWEYLLAAATQMERGSAPLLVVRHLNRGPQAAVWSPPHKPLIVVSAPGEISEYYAFDSEQKLIESHLGAPPGATLSNPSLQRLKQEVAARQPDLVHLTGLDSHEGARLLGLETRRVLDGVMLEGPGGEPEAIRAEDLAHALTAGGLPQIFGCNTYNSASRICALAVAEGVQAAVGFQDEIDDTLAELFFATFYRSWNSSTGRSPLDAFQTALVEIQDHPISMSGSCIILWSAVSLLEATTRDSMVEESKRLRFELQQDRAQEAPATGTGDGTMRDLIDIDVKALEELNYSLLHNRKPAFARFKLRKFTPHTISGVEVEVTLRLENKEFPYRTRFDLTESTKPLHKEIFIPLTWDLASRVREAVWTNLDVTVRHHGATYYQQSHPVRLQPADLWQDRAADWSWLPSFVFPRDPQIQSVVDRAQKYLIALADDRRASFDGYQSGDPELVDLQVRAIWSSLVLDQRLSYIEPPPTYIKFSQRLRDPSSILEGRRGTCIDLALLFCSAIEFVGLHPVVFLLKGHAFPGYWRDPDRRIELLNMVGTDVAPDDRDTVSSRGSDNGSEPTDPWVLGEARFEDLQALVLAEDLLPVETVGLTDQRGLGGVRRRRAEGAEPEGVL